MGAAINRKEGNKKMKYKIIIRCINPNCGKEIKTGDDKVTFQVPRPDVIRLERNAMKYKPPKIDFACSEKCMYEYLESVKEK